MAVYSLTSHFNTVDKSENLLVVLLFLLWSLFIRTSLSLWLLIPLAAALALAPALSL
jgi:hypothetical protein